MIIGQWRMSTHNHDGRVEASMKTVTNFGADVCHPRRGILCRYYRLSPYWRWWLVFVSMHHGVLSIIGSMPIPCRRRNVRSIGVGGWTNLSFMSRRPSCVTVPPGVYPSFSLIHCTIWTVSDDNSVRRSDRNKIKCGSLYRSLPIPYRY